MYTKDPSSPFISPYRLLKYATLAALFVLCNLLVIAQPKEPNTVGIYFNRLYNNPEVKQKCVFCPLIASDLSKAPGVGILERQNINKIIDEKTLSTTGLVAENTKLQEGQIISPSNFITVTGINYAEKGGFSLDAIENYSYTNLKTGRIVWSKNAGGYSPSVSEPLLKLSSGTYKPPVKSQAVPGRTLRTVYVDIPVEYNFNFKGIYPKVEEGEETVIRESKEAIVLKDGQETDRKKNVLSFGALNGAEGTYTGTDFTVFFKPSVSAEDAIWMKGKFSIDKSKLEFLEIHYSKLSLLNYSESYNRRESENDFVKVENLVYKKTPMGGQYEFVPGVSKIQEIQSEIGFYESGDMPKRILTSSHIFKQIDAGRTDPVRGKVIPMIYLMITENTPVPATKPFRKIYIRGNWVGYTLLTEKLLEKFPNAEIYDQTETFNQQIAFEKSVNPGMKPATGIPGVNITDQPLVGEAIIQFSSQPDENGVTKITVDIKTSSNSQSINFDLPPLFKPDATLFSGVPADDEALEQLSKQQADFIYSRILALGNLVVGALNK